MNCIYRHCLPVGYIIKAKNKDEKKEKIESHIEEEIDDIRSKLNVEKGTKMTKDLFLSWKEERKKKKEKEIEEKKNAETKKQTGKGANHGLTGRALFKFDPTLFVDDDEAVDEKVYENREAEDDDDETTTVERNDTQMEKIMEQV